MKVVTILKKYWTHFRGLKFEDIGNVQFSKTTSTDFRKQLHQAFSFEKNAVLYLKENNIFKNICKTIWKHFQDFKKLRLLNIDLIEPIRNCGSLKVLRLKHFSILSTCI